MAIVKMSKFTLLAFKSQKEELLQRLQRFENIQFIDLKEKEDEELSFLTFNRDGENLSKVQADLAKVKFSLDMLKEFVPKEGAIEALKKGKLTLSHDELTKRVHAINWQNIYQGLKEKDDTLNEIKNEVSKIHSELEVLSPWGNLDASFGDLKKLNRCGYFVGTIPKMFKNKFLQELNEKVKNSYAEVLNEVKGEACILVIAHNSELELAGEILKSNSFAKVNVNCDEKPVDAINSFNRKLKHLKIIEDKIKDEMKEQAKYKKDLQMVYGYISNKELLSKAEDNFLSSESLVVINGWVPTSEVEKLEKRIKSVSKDQYYLEVKEAKADDPEVPVMLKNGKVVSAFESITSMFSTPRYNEIDPTPYLTPFYLVFFGMMVADVGYGILMFIAALYALKKFKLDEKQQGFARFFLYLSFPTMVVGALYGSYFGDILGIKGLVNPGEDVITIMAASLVLGIVQIYTGLGIKTYMLLRDGLIKDAIYDTGSWYLTLTGGLVLLGGSFLGVPSSIVAIFKWIMIVGMVMIVLTQGRANKSIGAKLGGGLYALYNISGYVGDLVSYSRLMALGLAGGFIGSAFNLMIGMLGNPIAKILAGSLIFVAGHIFNLLLGALSAYVHTCRLQYVEYFGKFYEGGGKPFTPFKSNSKYLNFKKDE